MFPLRLWIRQGCPLLINIILEVPANAVRKKKWYKGVQIVMKDKTAYACRGHDCICKKKKILA